MVIFLHGDLSDDNLHNWLVKANKVFVNNFGGVFAERCVNSGSKWHLDHYIAGLLASMEEGTIIVTLSDLVSAVFPFMVFAQVHECSNNSSQPIFSSNMSLFVF